MNSELARAHKATNALHSCVLLGAMGIVFLLLGYLLGGVRGAVLVSGAGLFLLWFSPRIAPSVIMRLYGAQSVRRGEISQIQEIVHLLARRAGLSRVPRLYYVPTRLMNAFTVGDRENSAIGLTDGLLRALNLRELAGVLAHEVSHVRNNDMRVMTLADVVSRVASTFQTLALLSVAFMALAGARIPWLVLMGLLATPTVLAMLQLALSRTREFDADVGALELTGDAVGLASALGKMERYQQRFLDRILATGRQVPAPSILRSHPNTEERIRRLVELADSPPSEPRYADARTFGGSFTVPDALTLIDRAPRWHVSGLWY